MKYDIAEYNFLPRSVLETVGTKNRATIGIVCRIGWALGYLILPGIAAMFSSFRHIQMACTLPEILWVFWLWKIPESPRWQLAKGQVEKAHKEMRRAAEINSRPMIGIDEQLRRLDKSLEKVSF